jgi:thiamine monophosphate synthase
VPGGEVVRAKVLTFRSSEPWLGDRTAGDRRRGRALEQQAVRTARRGGIVRIALRAKDLRKEHRSISALAAIDAARAAGATPSVHRGFRAAALPAA